VERAGKEILAQKHNEEREKKEAEAKERLEKELQAKKDRV
jgi:hypothetical protein